jgi:YVTN family beta-propeller protein
VDEFRVLGSLELRGPDGPIAVTGTKQRVLLAILLLHAEEPVSREALIDALWPEDPPAGAGHTLESHVWRLRRTLRELDADGDLVVADAGGYRIALNGHEVDKRRYEALAAAARSARECGDPATAAEAARSALGLWRGAALANLATHPALAGDAAALEESRLQVLELLAEAELACGRPDAAVSALSPEAARQPRRERLHELLMLALYRAGRQADALEVYRTARRELVDTLGLEPGPALRDLHQRILLHDTSLAAPLAIVDQSPPAERDEDGMPGSAGRRRSIAPPALRHRALRTAALVVGIGAVAAVVVLLAARTRQDGWRSVKPGASVLAALDSYGRPGSSLELRAAATNVAAGLGAAWVSSYDDGTLQRLEVSGDTTAQVTRVGSGATGVAVGGGDVWVANALDDTVARVDARTQTVVQTIRVGRRPQDVAAAGGSIWVSNRGDGTLMRIDARSGIVRGTVRVGPEPSGLAAGPGGVVWAAVSGAGRLLRIDATTGRVEDAVNVGSGPSALAFADGALWVANELDATVSLVDARTGVVRLTRSVDGTPTALAATPAGVWVAVRDRSTLTHIDRSGVRRSSRLPAPATALATDGGRVLVAVGTRGDVHRGGTLRVRWSFPLQATDPYVCCDAPMNLRALSYDGLLAVAKTPGSPGQLVPDLADAVPRPEGGGRLYRFRLRPGVRYWTGARVRASDVRRGLERAARTNGAYATDLAALGARACGPHRGCDLSRAVLTDDRAGTITLRLRRADPDLLTALAQPTFAPTPQATGPVPGTGPYQIARFVPGRLLELRRNRFFVASAPAAQPTGAPDRIIWRFGGSPSAAVAAVLHGEADYTFDPPSAEQRANVLLRSPAQLLTVPTPTIAYFALDARTRPFDDVRVRRAVNFALDRAAIARIWGGPGIATPFCQALPAGLLGHQRFCPYTRRPSISGRWSGPDVARAKRLMAAAPGRHATVQIWGQTGPDGAMARMFGRTLRRLGLHSRVLVGSPQRWEAAISNTRHPPQAITQGWGDDSPAQFIGLQLTCRQWSPPTRTSNHSRFCDPVVDRLAAAAHRLQTTDPARAARLWHRADVRVTAAAPWVVAVQFNGTELVSRRVHDFRYVPAFGTLIDQLWIR